VGSKSLYYKPSNYLKKGDASFRKKLYWEAYDYYNMALRDDPYSIVIQVKLANVQLKLRNTPQAMYRLRCVINQTGANTILQNYVIRNYKNMGKNIGTLQRQLKSSFNIPITQKPLRQLLQIIKNEVKEPIEQEEFAKFTRMLPWRDFIILADFIDPFIKHYGKDYKNHIPQLHRYLIGRSYNISLYELEKRIRKQKQMMNRPTWRYQQNIDLMTGIEFERYLADYFQRIGYNVTVTQPSHDKGCDLLLKGFGKRKVVQAKRQKTNVGTTAVMAAYSAKKLYHAQEAMVITNSNFTAPAKKMAKKLGVELWNRQRLLKESSWS